jgi:hypothetical protein
MRYPAARRELMERLRVFRFPTLPWAEAVAEDLLAAGYEVELDRRPDRAGAWRLTVTGDDEHMNAFTRQPRPYDWAAFVNRLEISPL